MNRWSIPKHWAVLLLILLTPLQVYCLTLPGETDLTLSFAFTALMFPLFLMNPGLSYPLPVYAMGGYILWSLVGVFFAGMPWDGVRGVGVQGLFMLHMVYALRYLRTRQALEHAVTAIIAAGLLSAAMGCAEFFPYVLFGKKIFPPFIDSAKHLESGAISGYGYMNNLMRMHGFYFSSNRLGPCLLIPFALALYRALHGERRRLYGGAAAFLLMTIGLALARSAYLGMIVMSAVLSLRWARTFRRRFALGLAAAGAVVFLYATPETGIDPIDHANPFRIAEELDRNSRQSSWELWAEHALAAASAAALTGGVGRGVQSFDEWAYASGRVGTWGSHSDFILYLGESGLVGFLCQLGILLFVVRLCWRGYLRERAAGSPPLSLYLLGAYLGTVMTGLVRTYYHIESTYMFIGILLQAHRLGALGAAPASGPRPAEASA